MNHLNHQAVFSTASSTEDPIDELVSLLSRLPGIGERSATRLAFFMLAQRPEYAKALSANLSDIHQRVRKCHECGNYGLNEVCRICADPRRDRQTLCIVAHVQDLLAVERTSSYRGIYHVLHTLLSPLDGVHPENLHPEKLLDRIGSTDVQEVILATPLSVEGEATALYLAQSLRAAPCRVTRIASGLPHGAELEFTDQVTMGHAFAGRKAF